MLCLIIIKVLPDYFALQMSYAVYLKRYYTEEYVKYQLYL